MFKLEYWVGSTWMTIKNRHFQAMVFTSIEDAEYVAFLLTRSENMSKCHGDWRIMDVTGKQHYCRADGSNDRR